MRGSRSLGDLGPLRGDMGSALVAQHMKVCHRSSQIEIQIDFNFETIQIQLFSTVFNCLQLI